MSISSDFFFNYSSTAINVRTCFFVRTRPCC